jgi:hypothetical protein
MTCIAQHAPEHVCIQVTGDSSDHSPAVVACVVPSDGTVSVVCAIVAEAHVVTNLCGAGQ